MTFGIYRFTFSATHATVQHDWLDLVYDIQEQYLKKCYEYASLTESKQLTDNAFLEDEYGVPVTYYEAGLDLHLALGSIHRFPSC